MASLADAGVVGVTDLADAGAASLAAPAGIVAGAIMDWNVPDLVETVDLPLLQGCVVRNYSSVDGSEKWCDDFW